MKLMQSVSNSFLALSLIVSTSLLVQQSLGAKKAACKISAEKVAGSTINAAFINTTQTDLTIRVTSKGTFPSAVAYTSFEEVIPANSEKSLPENIHKLFDPELVGASHTCEILNANGGVLYIIENKYLSGDVTIELHADKPDIRM